MAGAERGRSGSQSVATPFKILWRDADSAGWVHYASVTRYFDEAEEQLLAKYGLNYAEELNQGRGFPRVHFECDFRLPLRVGDGGFTHAEIAKVGRSSVEISFALIKRGDATPSVVGRVVIVAIDWASKSPTPVPAELSAYCGS